MRGAISPLRQYVFMAWCLVKHRDNFTLPLTLCVASQRVFIVVVVYFVIRKLWNTQNLLNSFGYETRRVALSTHTMRSFMDFIRRLRLKKNGENVAKEMQSA
jgi:hypothetical protein